MKRYLKRLAAFLIDASLYCIEPLARRISPPSTRLYRFALTIIRLSGRNLYSLQGAIFDNPDGPFHVTFSQEAEDMILEALLESRAPGFFVDVGALHPIRFSNTYLFYQRGWRGINIEPNKDAALAFQHIRPEDQFLNTGVSDESGSITYFVMDEPALNTFDPERVKYLEQTTRYRCIETVETPVATLTSILEGARTPERIDFMSIDVENRELNVLRSNDWDRYRPEFVLVEVLNKDLAAIETDPVHQFMLSVNYTFVAGTLRTVFYRDALRAVDSRN
jgi:FkbM family methyltransferase